MSFNIPDAQGNNVAVGNTDGALHVAHAGVAGDIVSLITASSDAQAGVNITNVDPETGGIPTIVDLIISVGAAMSVEIKSSSETSLAIIYMAANSTVMLSPRGFLVGFEATNIQVVASASGQIAVLCNYFEG